jgi:hypothetical protein
MTAVGGYGPSLEGRFAPFAQANPQMATQMRERFQARMTQWQAQHPGASADDFRASMRAGFEQRLKSDYAQWQAANPGGTVEQFVEAHASQRRAALQARGIQLPQATEGAGMLSRMADHIRQLLSS